MPKDVRMCPKSSLDSASYFQLSGSSPVRAAGMKRSMVRTAAILSMFYRAGVIRESELHSLFILLLSVHCIDV